jgi:uncharacterized protein DUF6088
VLSLSSQVPRQIVSLIDGSSRKITVGNQIIHFKRACPRALPGVGTPRVSRFSRFVRSGLITLQLASFSIFGRIRSQMQRLV